MLRLPGFGLACGVLLGGRAARGDVMLLEEEPINLLGRVTATGHAALLVEGLCSDDHVTMRVCRGGETGAVLSRYDGTGGRDWLAMPPAAYLYGAEDGVAVPGSVTKADVERMRAEYRARHGAEFRQQPSEGVWTQLLGTAYRRRVFCLRLRTTREQDLRLLKWLNARGRTRFNFFYENCADFVREALDAVFAGAEHRNFVLDAGATTPKGLAAGLHGYAKRHPELGLRVTLIAQVPGELARSHRVYGGVESLAKTQFYLYPAAVFAPYEVGPVLLLGLCDRRWSPESLAKTAPAFVVGRVGE